jgi:hypothetical protein
MCPACLTTAALATAGVTSAGELMALVVRNVRPQNEAGSINPTTHEKGVQDESSKHRVRDEWLAARKRLLSKEKELTRQRDAVNAERRRLPMVRIDKDYLFEGPNGKVRLPDLFEQRRQLIVYHFMFDPSWDEGCPNCSFLVDNIGHLAHLHARDTSLALVSRAPLSKIEPFRRRMGSHAPGPAGGLGGTGRAQQQFVPGVGPAPRQVWQRHHGFGFPSRFRIGPSVKTL